MDLHRFWPPDPRTIHQLEACLVMMAVLFIIWACLKVNQYEIRIRRLVEHEREDSK